MQVRKWGDSLAVCLPDKLVESLSLKEGDEVDVIVTRSRPPLSQAEREAALENLRRFRGMIPADFKFNRDEANER